ncbi:MAG: glutamate racemase [Eubacteriales bacterium]|nr:glutamate racemase [Eubacteriales bacterium]
MNNNSIGVFDSGLGGLTAVKSIMELLPGENIVYFGDTGRLPYGTKTEETIKQYAAGDIRFLLSHNVKLIVIACGTASSVALSDMRNKFTTPIVGVVEAACEAAVKLTKNKKVGVLGTSATIKSESYLRGISEIDSGIKVYQKACPLFVPLVENGHFNTEVTRLVVKEYLEPIKNEGVDTLILGCTHYPLLEKAIAEYMGEEVRIVNVGAELAKSIGNILGKDNISDKTEGGICEYYVSDDEKGFAELGGVFLERKINGQVKKIDIEKY